MDSDLKKVRKCQEANGRSIWYKLKCVDVHKRVKQCRDISNRESASGWGKLGVVR